jgi:hypothetical protein
MDIFLYILKNLQVQFILIICVLFKFSYSKILNNFSGKYVFLNLNHKKSSQFLGSFNFFRDLDWIQTHRVSIRISIVYKHERYQGVYIATFMIELDCRKLSFNPL